MTYCTHSVHSPTTGFTLSTPSRNILLSVIFRIVVCVVLIGASLGVFGYLASTAPKPAPSQSTASVPRIEVYRAAPVAVRRAWEGFGTISAFEQADIPSRVTSTVITKPDHMRPGAAVSEGALLLQLDDSDYVRQTDIHTRTIQEIDAQLTRLEIEESSWSRRAALADEEVTLAQQEYDRISGALARDAARQREVDQARRVLLVAQLAAISTREELDKIVPRRESLLAQRGREEQNLALAKVNVERCRITSPIAGMLDAMDVEVGENVTAGQRVARVVNVGFVEAVVLLPSSARASVAVGDRVELRMESDRYSTPVSAPSDAAQSQLMELVWNSVIVRLSPADDEATRTMRVYAEVTQSDDAVNLLAPGRFVQAVVRSSRPMMRSVLPRRALTSERILIVQDGRVSSRPIAVDFSLTADLPETGLVDRHWVVLHEPLPEGTLVVVDGSRSLADGTAVEPVITPSQASTSPDENARSRAGATTIQGHTP